MTPAQQAYSSAVKLAFQELGDQRVTITAVTPKLYSERSVPREDVPEEKE